MALALVRVMWQQPGAVQYLRASQQGGRACQLHLGWEWGPQPPLVVAAGWYCWGLNKAGWMLVMALQMLLQADPEMWLMVLVCVSGMQGLVLAGPRFVVTVVAQRMVVQTGCWVAQGMAQAMLVALLLASLTVVVAVVVVVVVVAHTMLVMKAPAPH